MPRFSNNPNSALRLLIAAVAVVCACSLSLLIQPRVISYFRHRFVNEDTLFQLSLLPRLGLVFLCGVVIMSVLFFVWFSACWLAKKTNNALNSKTPARIVGLILGCFANLAAVGIGLLGASALLPQILYAYYRVVFTGLPNQWVVQKPSLHTLATAFSGSPIDSLNTAMTVMVVVSCVFLVILAWFVFTRPTAHDPRE